MSNSWRVGIDHSARTELKSNGLFSISRNPVFWGMLVTLAGIFFILPNATTLIVAIVSVLFFHVQVRLEENIYLKYMLTYVLHIVKKYDIGFTLNNRETKHNTNYQSE